MRRYSMMLCVALGLLVCLASGCSPKKKDAGEDASQKKMGTGDYQQQMTKQKQTK